MTTISRLPLHPILFAAYAVLFLWAANLNEVLLVDAVAPLGWNVVGATAVLGVAAVPFRDARRGAIVASALVVCFCAFGHLAPAGKDLGLEEPVQLAIWSAVVIAATIHAARARGTLAGTTGALNGVAALLVFLALVQIVPYEASRTTRAAAAPNGTVAARTSATGTPDVYFVVFDRYGSADAIARRFDIADNDLYEWLAAQGFQLPEDSRANYRATDFSLAATLNMRLLDHLTAEVGRVSSDRTPARQMLREHEVGRFLKAQGYRYYHLGSWFGPTASNPMADANLALGATSEFEAVLRDTTVVPAVERLLGIEAAGLTFRDRHREGALFQFRQLHRLASAPGPKFVFAHVVLPHAPYVFRADGTVILEAEARAADEAALYAGQLAFLNARIKELVERLLAGPDESDPIVILQGDEGPLMCRNVDCPTDTPEYFATRFRILNAMYLPGVDEALPDTFTSVNTFRTLFRAYFGADLEPLPDRSFTWPDNDHLYDFRDVTDRIAPLLGRPDT